MVIVKADRKLLLDYLGSGAAVFDSELGFPTAPPPTECLYLCWESKHDLEKGVLPSYLFVPDNSIKDFLAWASTFIGTLKPLTSFVRVLEWSLAQVAFEHFGPVDITRFEKAIIGLVIGEGITKYKLINPSELSILQARYTASYTMGRAFSVGLMVPCLDTLMKRCHRTFKHDKSRLNTSNNAEEIYLIWSLVRRLARSDSKGNRGWSQLIQSSKIVIDGSVFDFYMDYIFQACQEIMRDGDICEKTWNRLSNNCDLYTEMKEVMQSPIERRVLFLDKVMSDPNVKGIEIPFAQHFLAAYLTYKINPGAMTHCSLLQEVVNNEQSTAMIWYGLISGLTPKSDLLASFDCLGRRVLRDLTRRSELFDLPTCDVAIEELDIACGGENTLTYFKKFAEKELRVEILPHVNVSIPISDYNSDQPGSDSLNKRLLVELGDNLERVFEVYFALKKQNLTPDNSSVVHEYQNNKKFYPSKGVDKTAKSSFGKKVVNSNEQQSFFSKKRVEKTPKK